jgi:hypothetical protein
MEQSAGWPGAAAAAAAMMVVACLVAIWALWHSFFKPREHVVLVA